MPFLDVGVGILTVIFLTKIFQKDMTFLILFAGILFSLFPDIDFLYWIKKKDSNHRKFPHYPIIYLVLFIILFFIDRFFSLLFFLPILFHLIHDSFFLGWGVKWFWPFSKKSFKFFPDKNGKITSKILLTWEESEEKSIKKEYGTKNWIREFYLKINFYSVLEYGTFIFALILLYKL